MPQPSRYALYFVPPADGALYRFGASVLGYDCYGGGDVACRTELDRWGPDWAAVVREPRKYGFHATLKAPFRLADGCDEGQLLDAFEAFAAGGHAPPAIDPVVTALGAFVAIVPRERSKTLHALADACVTTFDRFRAPPTADERRRRVDGGLTETQIAHLDRWGYPYVFEQFRFHMTLTGPLDTAPRARALALLQDDFAAAAPGRFCIDGVSLLRQDTPASPFRILRQAGLSACEHGHAQQHTGG